MNIVTEKIDSIVGIKSRIRQLEVEENNLTKPTYHDMSLIGEMYLVFCKALKEINGAINPEAAVQRCKFVLLMVLLFCPSSLAGEKLKIGLRDQLAKITRQKQTSISHDIKRALSYVRYYRTFQSDISYIHKKITDSFGEECNNVNISSRDVSKVKPKRIDTK